MKDLRLTSACKNDLKRITKRGYDRGLLDAVVALLRDAQLFRRRGGITPCRAIGRAAANAMSCRRRAPLRRA